MMRVLLPTHLAQLARTPREVTLDISGAPSIGSVLDALEARYPMLRGTLRDQTTLRRRDFVRFFALDQDISLEPPETLLPEAVARGDAPFRIIGAMAGG